MNERTTLFTIGFAGKSAEVFFSLLRRHAVKQVIDVRLYNSSQLAGFTKRDDLTYFLQSLLGATYMHKANFAPTKTLLNDYKKGVISWEEYEKQYKDILVQRQSQKGLALMSLDHACLLCSEAEPTHCHRRLAAEYLQHIWPDISIQHI
jgi:uncharacterized protein (DUF488 family)